MLLNLKVLRFECPLFRSIAILIRGDVRVWASTNDVTQLIDAEKRITKRLMIVRTSFQLLLPFVFTRRMTFYVIPIIH